MGPLQPHTAPSHGAALPRRLDYRRAVTRVKDACGAGFAGRAKARSLTQASRARGRGSSAGKGHPGPVQRALQATHSTANPTSAPT